MWKELESRQTRWALAFGLGCFGCSAPDTGSAFDSGSGGGGGGGASGASGISTAGGAGGATGTGGAGTAAGTDGGGTSGSGGESGADSGAEVTTGSASTTAGGAGGAGGGAVSGTATGTSSPTTSGGAGGATSTTSSTTSSDPPEVYLAKPAPGSEFFCSTEGGCEVEMLACSNTQDPIWLYQCCSLEHVPEPEPNCPESHPFGVKRTSVVWDSPEQAGAWLEPTIIRVAFTTDSFQEAPGTEVWIDSDPVPVDFADRETFCGATAESEYHVAPLIVSVGDGTPEAIELEVFRDGESVFLGEEPFTGSASVNFGDFTFERGYNEIVARSVKATGLVGESAECVIDSR